MTSISLFTPINYARPRSCTEQVLSALSHYFYLSGKQRAIVVRGDEVRLEAGKISWYAISLKIASYVLLFPLALTLLAIHLGLRYQHNFTIINPAQPRQLFPIKPLNFAPRVQEVEDEVEVESENPAVPIEEAKKKEQPKEISDSKKEILANLIKYATKEQDAFLIDFSKVNPSNIFKIFNKGSYCSRIYGDVALDDRISYDESDKFIHNFPFKFSISVVNIEKNECGFNTSNSYMFTMNDEGKVESYGKVFDNFDLYLEHFMKDGVYSFSFEHLDFYSVGNDNNKKLRKKSSAINPI